MPDAPIRPRRSFIFAPGNKPEMFPKAMTTGADIMCVDLEDAIAPQHKAAARATTLSWFAEAALDGSVEAMVRINPPRTPDGMRDVDAILSSPKAPPALMLPKVKTPGEITALAELFDEFKIPARLHVIIETNEALEAAWEIARASERIDALFFGGVDMAADLRCRTSWQALLYARSRVVHAAAGAGVDVIDVPYLDLNDIDGMRREAEAAEELGFSGKGSIHPKQVPILNEVFTPSAAAVAHAKRIVAAFEQADTGLVVVDGKLMEKPVLRSMYRVLARAGQV
ncbi:MAG: CoA ester lyase [Alphaproteobacteria bacterium]|nr:CoA ester lyase [Alphaproteobacteria bacterium]